MKLHIIPTGGTFDKVYEEKTGKLLVDERAASVSEIISLTRGNLDTHIEPIIHKDSNYFTDEDRELLLLKVTQSEHKNIIIIHGTDTMDKSAEYLAKNLPESQKCIIFVGSMKPYNISRDEAIFNLATAIGFLNANTSSGVYISMHGLVLQYNKIIKNREIGTFERVV